MKKLDVVIFEGKTFSEIPKADNPAFQPNTECILICKQTRHKARYKIPYRNMGRYVVLQIDSVAHPKEEEAVSQLGLFWDFNDALAFARIKAKDEVVHLVQVHKMCISSLSPELFANWESISKMLRFNRGLSKHES
jgi:hypothetical protein